MRAIVVTGGAGFIGSALIRELIAKSDALVVNLDKLTYAANLEALRSVEAHERYRFHQIDVCDAAGVRGVLERYRPDAVVHLAAESHVDRSIDGPGDFIQTNLVGTYTLLQEALRHFRSLDSARAESFRFHHVSTDEVFGSLESEGYFTEETAYSPNSPYAATKAGSDHLVRAWHHTFGLPVIVTNCSNNYGPYQFPEKLIPLVTLKAVAGERLPVYGKGDNVRDWLYVDDHAQALSLVLERGVPGETYNIGGRSERTNLEVVNAITDILDRVLPSSPHRPHRELIEFVTDRPGHDRRYAIDIAKIERELGWTPRESFESGLEKTVRWYLENRDFWQKIARERYAGERLGLGHSEPASGSGRAGSGMKGTGSS